MPHMPADDGGTWRRICRVEFTSKFTDYPNPKKPNEFKIDRELTQKFESWKETFMAILIRYYDKYRREGLKYPQKVLEYTKEYQRKNDIFADFCDNYMRKVEGAFLPVQSLFALFKDYCKNDNIRVSFKKTEFQEIIEKRFFSAVPNSQLGMGWKGLQIVTPVKQEESEETNTVDC